MQQALAYAEALNTPFVFASNGDGFLQHHRTGQSAQRETTLALDAFPSPEELWRRYSRWKGFTPQQEKVVLQPYYDGGSRKDPRYYQINAIQATVEAITKGQQRILLVMATGLGLYQALTGPEERQKLYKDFSAGFFDLIVVDECHRGSAAEDSAWREILDCFSAATPRLA
jgi:type I site-specific restriction endonuclease